MEKNKTILVILSAMIILGFALAYPNVSAQSVPDWIKNTALWYGQGKTSETEFLNAIKFLIENEIITLENEMVKKTQTTGIAQNTANIIIPNGNANIERTGFYVPLNLEINKGTTVVWVNDDAVIHTVQSIDENGHIVGLFNSAPLSTGQRFAYTFDEDGTFNYFCSLHPWRVGSVTVG